MTASIVRDTVSPANSFDSYLAWMRRQSDNLHKATPLEAEAIQRDMESATRAIRSGEAARLSKAMESVKADWSKLEQREAQAKARAQSISKDAREAAEFAARRLQASSLGSLFQEYETALASGNRDTVRAMTSVIAAEASRRLRQDKTIPSEDRPELNRLMNNALAANESWLYKTPELQEIQGQWDSLIPKAEGLLNQIEQRSAILRSNEIGKLTQGWTVKRHSRADGKVETAVQYRIDEAPKRIYAQELEAPDELPLEPTDSIMGGH